MAAKSWHLDRRSFLLGSGVSLGLPWLECMGTEAPKQAIQPRRLCAMYFGFGVSLPKEGSEQAMWRWFPNGEGRAFEFTETLKPLNDHRESLTVLGGLSHPNGRRTEAPQGQAAEPARSPSSDQRPHSRRCRAFDHPVALQRW